MAKGTSKTKKKPARRRSKKVPPEWPAAKLEARPTSKLVPYANNARTHSKGQVASIAASIKEWGWTTPVLVAEDNTIIAGHGRVLAAQLLEIETVPVLVARGWSDAQRRAYVIADNKLALDAGWDNSLLALELGSLAELDFDLDLTGFSGVELKTLLRGTSLQDDEDIPPLPEKATTQLGDVWVLGDHRVCCGDSTDPDTVNNFLASHSPGLMVTDLPYGVEYDPAWRNEANVSKTKRTGKVKNDDRVDWTAAWRLFTGNVAYVWHAGLHAGEVALNLREAGMDIRSQIIWVKSRFALSRGNYHWHHEPCWYAVRKGKKADWIGGRKESTAWEIANTTSGEGEAATVHGTQKPLECMGRPMRNHDSEEVYDPFLGSGSTLIAAQMQDRVCLAIDIDPRYVDVAVMRWQNLTGKDAYLEGDGCTFNAAALGERCGR